MKPILVSATFLHIIFFHLVFGQPIIQKPAFSRAPSVSRYEKTLQAISPEQQSSATVPAASKRSQITFLSPAQNRVGVSRSVTIEVEFSTPLDTLNFSPEAVNVIGSLTGYYPFSVGFRYDANRNAIGLNIVPDIEFKPGETVWVILAYGIPLTGNVFFKGFAWMFTVSAAPGRATFSSQKNFSTGSSNPPWHLTCADLDNDSDIDIITANPSQSISVLMNDGNGNFSVGNVYSLQGFPVFVTTGDYNRDGFVDVAVANEQYLYVYMNTGDGALTLPKSYYTPYPGRTWERCWSVANMDVNLDGWLELVVSNVTGYGSLTVFWNDGTGNFSLYGNYTTPTYDPEEVASADVDNDGDFDVLYAGGTYGDVSVFLNQFENIVYSHSVQTSGKLTSLYVNDFTGDGFVDALMGTGFYDPQDNKIILARSDGTGNFPSVLTYTVKTNPNAAAGGDFNGDGLLDAAVVHNTISSTDVVSVMLNDSSGGLNAPNYFGSQNYSPFAVGCADFDNDGTLDIAVANAGASWVSVFYNDRLTAITPVHAAVPTEFRLFQNYPNPFNPSTTIEFALPEAADVQLVIYNALGQEVATGVKGRLSAGVHRVTWEAGALPSGVYFYQLRSKAFTQTRKMLLMR